MREADISVRLTRPGQHDLAVRRLGGLAFGLYASPACLDRHDEPHFADVCLGHHLVTQLSDVQDATQADWLADLAPRARIAIQTSSHEAAVAAALHGGGLACLARLRADREPGLTHLAVPTPVPSAGIWLVVHKDNRANARIRVVLTHIVDCARKLADTLLPSDDRQQGGRRQSFQRWTRARRVLIRIVGHLSLSERAHNLIA